MAHTDLPREKLARAGVGALSKEELLAILLRTGGAGRPVMNLARQLLDRLGGLRGLFAADLETLMRQPGLGLAKSAQLLAVMELARRHLLETI
ncbi:MAG: UPF0758 domain-containing protein, partial [Xanthomonadales bacterium]|nr:UPF0758 domain-containing protein [Xanthomonadales bacterium]